jgi:hypothetical protein
VIHLPSVVLHQIAEHIARIAPAYRTYFLVQIPLQRPRGYKYAVNLNTIRQKIIDSTREDWNKISCWGADSGPDYHYGLSSGRGDNGIQTEAKGHGNIAVLIGDVDISISWGYDPDETLRTEHRPPHNFSDWLPIADAQHDYRIYADVFYRGALIDRELSPKRGSTTCLFHGGSITTRIVSLSFTTRRGSWASPPS